MLLQSGDDKTLSLWRQLVDESTRHFTQVYELLGIGLSSGDAYGESFYNPFLAALVDDLTRAGLTAISDGAVGAFPDGFRNREASRCRSSFASGTAVTAMRPPISRPCATGRNSAGSPICFTSSARPEHSISR